MIQFTFDQISTFVAVCQHGSFAKAAKILRKDRSTLSEHVSNLEITLGIILFDRTSNTLKLTKERQLIHHQASLLLQHASGLEQSAINYQCAEGTEFTISLETTVPDTIITHIDKHMSSHFSEKIFNWVHYDRDNAFNLLLEAEVDVLILLPNDCARQVLPPKGIETCALGTLPGAFYTSINSPLQQLDVVSIRELQLEKRYVLKNFVDAGLSNRNKFSNHQQVIDKEELLLELLLHSGWAFLPKHVIKNNHNGIVELNTDFLNDIWQIRYQVLYRSSNGKVIPELIKEIKKQFSLMATSK